MRISLSVLVVLLLWTADAAAHTRSQSFSTWTVSERGQVVGTVTAPAREVTRLPAAEGPLRDLDALLARHVTRNMAVLGDGKTCTPAAAARPLRSESGYVRVEIVFDCGGAARIALESTLFLPVASGHTHFARLTGSDEFREFLFTDTDRSHVLVERGGAAAPSTGAVLGDYVAIGVEHILLGYDHLAFLLALMLLSLRLRSLIFIATGFTIGHSITLSLAALGFVQIDIGVVEAMIGLTIALVAAENIAVRSHISRLLALIAGITFAGLLILALGGMGPSWPVMAGLGLFSACFLLVADDRETAIRIRPAITLVFGLVHGFGFAGALGDVGLPQDRLVAALFGFNVGVELGQIAVIVAGVLIAHAAARLLPKRAYVPAVETISAGLFGLGLFWFLVRGYGV